MSLLLGIDLGTSFIKVSVVDANTSRTIVTAQYPDVENEIKSLQTGWAEQDPELWWEHVKFAILRAHASEKYDPKNIVAIGIAYQMHGLVLVDKDQRLLRDGIIWCDNRAVGIGNRAFEEIGEAKCLKNLLNSPGNFTASKLAWVKENEPEIYQRIDKMMLPGDFIAMKMSGQITTTPSALSEGILYDFEKDDISSDVMNYFEFKSDLIPEVKPVFSVHGFLQKSVAGEIFLNPGVPISYKAGDQLNNALSLNVLQPGQAAASAGTSGVIYSISDKPTSDRYSRINGFAHVNHSKEHRRVGVMVCINGCGIMNNWIKKSLAPTASYEQMNMAAAKIPTGSAGLKVLPFGNGAERILGNQNIGSQILDIDLNRHNTNHVCRATLEGIAFAFRFGLDILHENNINLSVVRAGKAGLFMSNVFTEIFVNVTNTRVDMYNDESGTGAAIGAGIGAGMYKDQQHAFENLKADTTIYPSGDKIYEAFYQSWKEALLRKIDALH